MNLNLNPDLAKGYKSNSQIARVLTEDWVEKNAYCPNCGNALTHYENNKPVADFFCSNCNKEFELKSKNSKIGKKIVDGNYFKVIERIESENNPNFFFLTYDKNNWKIIDFLIVPNYYFTPDIIERRKPLPKTARRAGWIGCSIVLSKIPESGKIFLVRSKNIIPKQLVIEKWNKTTFLEKKKGESRSWIIDILNCVDTINKQNFSLKDMYEFEEQLKKKHPNNNFIEDKIRQQLQVLRDRGIIEFLGNGNYRKIKI